MVPGKKLLTDWKSVVCLEKSSIYYVEVFRWGPRSIIPTLGKYDRKQAFYSIYCQREGYENCVDVFFVLCWIDKGLRVLGDGYRLHCCLNRQHFLTNPRAECISEAWLVQCYCNQCSCFHLICISYISLATVICNTWCHLWKLCY